MRELAELLIQLSCSLFCFAILVSLVAVFMTAYLYYLCLSWVYRDCTRRGADPTPWMFIVAFLGFLGLAFYLIYRKEASVT